MSGSLARQLAVIASTGVVACSAGSGDVYAGRNGEAEALGAFNAGKPLTIYAHVANGVAPGWVSPGLASCSPMEATSDVRPGVFRPMDEADFQEGDVRTVAQQRLARSAVTFATAYNATNFRLRRAEIEKVCPHVRLG